MNYPTNHPFSPRYESQIPLTDSDRRSARARAYMARMAEAGLPNASKQSFPPMHAMTAVKGRCPTCAGDLSHQNRKTRQVDNKKIYVCKGCALKLDKMKAAR